MVKLVCDFERRAGQSHRLHVRDDRDDHPLREDRVPSFVLLNLIAGEHQEHAAGPHGGPRVRHVVPALPTLAVLVQFLHNHPGLGVTLVPVPADLGAVDGGPQLHHGLGFEEPGEQTLSVLQLAQLVAVEEGVAKEEQVAHVGEEAASCPLVGVVYVGTVDHTLLLVNVIISTGKLNTKINI